MSGCVRVDVRAHRELCASISLALGGVDVGHTASFAPAFHELGVRGAEMRTWTRISRFGSVGSYWFFDLQQQVAAGTIVSGETTNVRHGDVCAEIDALWSMIDERVCFWQYDLDNNMERD